MKNYQILPILFSLLFLFATRNFAQDPIHRIEPPNWWTGMAHQQLELMIYGDDIGEYTPKINYEGVALERITRVKNPNYLFLKLKIGAATQAGTLQIDFYKNQKKVVSKNYDLLARENSRVNLEGFNTSDAIYLITPDRFANGKESNDNIEGQREKVNRSFKGGRHGGDIEGIRKNLDYIKGLGFTAVWLNPLLENNMETYSYHGYSTTDYYKVDPRFGTNEEYRALAEEGRSKGIKLIMDMIVNHCGSEHWWMEDSPTDDWINHWPEYTETSHRKTVIQDPYASDLDKKVFTDGWFVKTMPDLNQRNELMATYLIQNSIWWVEYLGLAGIRMDTYPYPDMDFMTDWTKAMMVEYPDLNIVGEEWNGRPAIVAYWQKGKINPNGYTSDLRSLMDFPVQQALVNALNHEESWSTGWIELYEMMAQDFLYADPTNLVTFPDNHDMARFYAQVGEDFDWFKQGLVFVATTRGIPQYYYGTEILMSSPAERDDGLIRSDFPGGWKGDATNGFTGVGLTDQQKEAKRYLTKLLEWRKSAKVVHEGDLKHFVPKDGFYVYFRYTGAQKIMVILNKNEEARSLSLDRFSEVLSGTTSGKDVLTGQTFSMNSSIKLSPKTPLILELR